MGNFDWSLIIGPLVGAVIGYCTNYIAVKMLFRPLTKKKIGNYRVPFTPGIIPREKPRLARAVGEAVGKTLLTQETIANNLLTDEIKDKIRSEVNDYLLKASKDEEKLIDKLCKATSEEKVYDKIEDVKSAITNKLYTKVIDMKLGKVVSEQVVKAVKQKLQGGLFAMMLNDEAINNMIGPVSDMIDVYIERNGEEVISDKVSEEVDKFMLKETGELVQYLNISELDYGDMAVKIYISFVNERLTHILDAVKIDKIVEDKINEMDVLEAEELLLSVMKKELNAIVNLGALIGFILGIVMIFV